MQSVLDDSRQRMKKALAALEHDFAKLRTGRATPSLVEDISVDYYGTPTPLKQIASISVPESRSLTIQPWDRGAFPAIEKAIMKSDLGLTPVNDGKIIRISIPPLTEERRKELVKVAKKFTEDCRVAMRNIRRDGIDQLKKLQKDKAITEDELRTGQTDIQKITDDQIAEADKTLDAKEKEVMEI
jgi:ribosome recycling factor